MDASQSGVELFLRRRIRPVVVRFTEPGVSDFKTELCAETLVQNRSRRSDKGKGRQLDEDEANDSDSSASSSGTVTSSSPREKILKRTDETVDSFRKRIRDSHLPPELQKRQLRLIHAGRILRDDSIKLVDWLDSLDAKRNKSLQSQGSAVVSQPRDEGDLEDKENEELVREITRQGKRAGKEALRAAKNIGGWIEDRVMPTSVSSSSPILPRFQSGPHVLFDDDDLDESNEDTPSKRDKGKGKAKEEPAMQVQESRAPDTIYIQCSVGSEDVPDTVRASGGKPSKKEPEAPAQPALTGFDRLQETAGLNQEDISTMRYHFRRARADVLMDRSGDILRREEEDEHARALEEQWIDGMVTQNGEDASAAATASQSARTTWIGMTIGFFFPIIPLFFTSDRPHPSYFPSIHALPRIGDSDSEDDDEGDQNGPDQERIEARRLRAAQRRALRGGTVFNAPMQSAIIMGICANLFFSIFRDFFTPE